ncbi:hypothetical protein A3A93_06660 [Candidatus Roizmanbacteria bacterium RIFCSPLOWO2_01_FULL_38_12]|uniref:Uncharacterized protein n=1 Tax=Candidatus Roizmanbacteria bacterium RIFCSPLOWO2_01_FULL_38_12 TaxID=1802061 RepID=A0A1F7IRY1_9BACT|nr:MAG: hypothetical protein A3A93_06660 [Candidatus Roizmanbacteria bacterium RIFCSPLOWO2_01_FULL_38_12]
MRSRKINMKKRERKMAEEAMMIDFGCRNSVVSFLHHVIPLKKGIHETNLDPRFLGDDSHFFIDINRCFIYTSYISLGWALAPVQRDFFSSN